jgi:hypothetical protein
MEYEREEREHHREPPSRIFVSIVSAIQQLWDEHLECPAERPELLCGTSNAPAASKPQAADRRLIP